ncbi:MAG: carbohydrate kinase family protein [Bacteroidales bacterium]|jgi:ribokinase|nr:carbohydrate kinase family protein [Bacteroidales bacterium]
MENNDVFFIGDVALDEYYKAPYFPKLKDKIIVHTLASEMGGMIANAACVFSGYGGKASFIAALNESFISKKLCEELNRRGIDTQYIAWDNSLPDSKTIIILAENEHTVFIPTMNLQKLELSDKSYHALLNSKYIYSNVCELKPLKYKNNSIEVILNELKENKVNIWCDIDVGDISPEDYYFFKYIDTIFMNETGRTRLEKNITTNICECLFGYGVNNIIITEAENGCSVFSKNGEFLKIEGVNVNVVDVTGAGDTFCSSFLYSFLKTKDLLLSAEFANFAAARSVTGKGARYGSTRIETIINFIKAINNDYKKFEVLI